MQVNLLNLLLGIPASGNAAASDDGTGTPDIFAQLLNDPDLAAGQQPQGKAPNPLLADVTTTTLMAQDIGFANAKALLAQPITPQDAAKLITKINDLLAQGQGDAQQQKGWEDLKDALEPVAEGDQSVELGDVLEQVPEFSAPDDATPADHPNSTPLMRALAWVQQALEKKKEIASQPADAASQASLASLSNGLQAVMFRADDRPAAPAPEAAAPEKTEEIAQDAPGQFTENTIADAAAAIAAATAAITPVADAPAPTVVNVTPLSYAQEVSPEWLQAMIHGDKSATLDAAVPPLELKGDDALPVITLPQVASDADAAAELATATDAAKPTTPAPLKSDAWLKRLPFPLKASDQAASADAPEEVTEVETAEAITALPEPRKEAIKADTARAGDDHPIALTLATPATYTRQAQMQPAFVVPQHPLVPAKPADQVQVAIKNAVDEGLDRITIQLDPVDLGRVEVRMDVGNDGRTHMVFTADKASTLDMLSRGAHGLERSLAEGGIKADAGTMEFNLRQQPQFVQTDSNQQGQSGDRQPQANEDEPRDILAPLSAATPIPPVVQHLSLNVSAGVDIEA